MADEPKRKRKVKIGVQVEGVDKLVEQEVDEDSTLRWQPRAQMKLLGGRLPRVDGPAKVAAAAVYTCDVRPPRMLHGRILVSPWAHARIRWLDVAPALRLPGVRAAISAVDLYRALMVDKRTRIADANEIRYQGQPLAAVAAETPERAEDALLPDAPKVFREGNLEAKESKGDPAQVAADFARCATVVEAEYRTPV